MFSVKIIVLLAVCTAQYIIYTYVNIFISVVFFYNKHLANPKFCNFQLFWKSHSGPFSFVLVPLEGSSKLHPEVKCTGAGKGTIYYLKKTPQCSSYLFLTFLFLQKDLRLLSLTAFFVLNNLFVSDEFITGLTCN